MERHFYDPLKGNTGMSMMTVAGLILIIAFILGGAMYVGAQEQVLKVGVRLGDVSLNKLPFMIAYDHGIYKRNGLEVEQLIDRSAADVVARSGVIVPEHLILKGRRPDLPISICGCCPMMVRLITEAGAEDPVVIACTDPIVRWHIVSRSDITKPEQLKGKRIGYSGYGAVTHFIALAFAKIMGWDPTHDLSLMSGGLNVESLQKGHTDAFVASELHETMAMAAGFRDLLDLSQYNIPNAGSSVQVSRTWLKNNREAARRFVKSAVEALAFLNKDKKAAFSSMVKWFDLKDPKLQEYFYKKVEAIPHKPYPPFDGIRKVMEIFDCYEMRKYKPGDFYDASFVRELDQSGYINSLY